MLQINFQSVEKTLQNNFKCFLIFLLLSLLLFFKSIFYEYTFLDDKKLIVDNYYILKDISNIGTLFSRDIFLSTPYENVPYYRPILSVSFMIDILISGYNSLYFSHLTNILYHSIGAWLFFLLIRKFHYNIHVCFLLTVIFLVHPVLTQAVAWIPGRGDTLLGILVFSSLLFLINYIEKQKIIYFILYALFLILSLFTKESAIVLPFVCLVFLLMKKNKNIRVYLSFISVWLVAIIGWSLIRNLVIENSRHDYFENIMDNIFSNSPVIIQSLGKIILPFQLSVLPSIPDTPWVLGLISTLVLVNVLFVFMKKVQSRELLFFGIIIFLFFLLPSMIIRDPSMIGHDYQFEHRLYIPLAGFLIFISNFLQIENDEKTLQSFYLFGGFMALILFTLTFFYENNFKNRMAFWSNAVKTAPNSHASHVNMGSTFSTYRQFDLAINELNHALSIKPDDGGIFCELGAVYLKLNNLDFADYYLKKGLSLDSTSYIGYSNLAVVYLNSEKYDTALIYLSKALQLIPNHVNTLGNLGYCYLKTQQYDMAESTWKKALEYDPMHLQSHQNLTFFYAERKRYSEAIEHARIFVEMGGELDERFMGELERNNQ